jgi:signal transduction histidine kinase
VPAIDVIRSGKALWIESKEALISVYPHLAGDVRQGAYRVACLPIDVDGRVFGTLSFTFSGSGAFEEEERAFLGIVARHSGQALERLRLLEAEQSARVRAELLVQLASAVIASERVEEVYDAALDAILRALRAERASVLTFDDAGVMRFRAWRGISSDYRAVQEGHARWSKDTRTADALVIRDVRDLREVQGIGDARAESLLARFSAVLEAENIRTLVFIPLLAGGGLIGKFMVYYAEPTDVSAHDLALARAVANHAATAIARFSAIEELRQTVRFNEMFTAILGHDLRNPLGGIMAGAQLAMRRNEGEKLQKPLARIVNSAERMSRMIDQLLDFTRVRVGAGIPLRPSDTDLVPLLNQIIEELTDANPGWACRVDSLGDSRGSWDADRLAQVFSNLVGNAIQHGEAQSGVRVTIEGTQPDRVVVEIHNDGAVPEALIPTLFEPMTGGDRRRDKSTGLGLGLFITQQITAAHGGSIQVRSSAAAGTTITVALPRVTLGRAPP